MLWMLKQSPALQEIILCLDHDAAGIEATGRLTDILREQGYEGKTSSDESHGLIERQADALATALLMPIPQIKKCFYHLRSGKSKEQLIAEMAQIFQVSKQAIQIRLEAHNLL